MKATELLTKQHREVERIFMLIESGNGEVTNLVEQLADALVAHMAIEQQLFYPAVQKIDPDLILESFEAHAMAEVGLKRLIAADLMDPSFKAKVTVLKEMILRHVEEEEEDLFPKVEKTLGKERLEKLGAEMETMFSEALEEGYETTLTRGAPRTSVDDALIASMRQGLFGRPSSPSFA
jgi:iron-sulfur cluster repair protein YtfE (RIC family)